MTDYDVVLLPTFTQVEDWRKRGADARGAGLFSQVVTTFDAWIADMWELYGDGRSIVDSLQRQVIMRAAFGRVADEEGVVRASAGQDAGECLPWEPDSADGVQADGGLRLSPGVVKLAARCVEQAAGVPAFERAVEGVRTCAAVEGLSLRERALLAGIGAYCELLAGAGLVEAGHAAAYLAQRFEIVFPRRLRVLVANAAPLDWRMRSFFEACANLEVEVREAPGASGVERVADGVDLRFGFPSGRYAQPALVADLVREAAEGASDPGGDCSYAAVVTCAHPLALFRQLERELAGEGIALSVQARLPFASTDFGRCYLSLSRAVQDDEWDKADLSDAVAAPFSGFLRGDALAIDANLRKDRLVGRGDALQVLRAASDVFSQLEEVALDPDADILLGVFEQIAFSAPGRTDAWRSEQLAALRALRSCTGAARRVGASIQSCRAVLEQAAVSVSIECASPSLQRSRVHITTQESASQMGPGSCGVLVACDFTSDDYPVGDRDDAARTLFEKLGLLPVDTSLAHARRTFCALENLPARKLVCVRPLNDWEGNPTYPAAVLQELIDAYRVDVSSSKDLDEVYGVPASLLAGMAQRGEELLFANAALRGVSDAQPALCVAGRTERGEVAAANLGKVALPRRGADGRVLPGFSPSPSQVEAYLDCPYKWFAQSRLKVETIDEGFGALERGSYAHAVLYEFYRAFQEEGASKVSPDNIGRAREVMREVADAQALNQRSCDPGGGRYVAVTQIERRELEMCKEQLVSYLDFESRFLPTFHPAYFEYAIKPESGVKYAGHTFIGTLDRIDVDDRGNAVVVDYKGSVNGSHEIAGKTPDNPGKVQARMYAQVVKRLLGLNVVGAIYVSYGKAHVCAGAFDARAIDAAHLPDMRVDNSRCAVASTADALAEGEYALQSFTDMLDSTEQLVERAIASMEAGVVGPSPSSADSCAYCPAANCPKRGGR